MLSTEAEFLQFMCSLEKYSASISYMPGIILGVAGKARQPSRIPKADLSGRCKLIIKHISKAYHFSC